MRLLKLNTSGELSLQIFNGSDTPPYAILSHTWGDPHSEITFKDLENGLGKSKPGYAKVQFCANRAKLDGLEYFWIDTCCIDKLSSGELAESINSMFHWYKEAVKCYVYLSDVLWPTLSATGADGMTWKQAFGKSRWFTRGWTLPELLAPTSVEFFSQQGEFLGEKHAIAHHIQQITGIPIAALLGAPLGEFSLEERTQWAVHRQTARAEDSAYCLMGIFDVNMPLLYGEGRERALRRLMKNCTPSLRSTELEKPISHQPLFLTEPLFYYPLSEFGFRLFTLEPGAPRSPIIGLIREFDLSDPPGYYALSYVWGEEPLIHRVTINGQVKFVQPNLFHALQRIRPQIGQHRIWVDSLCINQPDSNERNMQVRQMAKVYNKASGVLIWLGEEDSTSKIAFEFVSKILSTTFKWEDSWWGEYGFVALAQILERPWFRRGWIIQEAAFSKTSSIHCGDREVHMSHFVMAINTVRDKLSTIPASHIPIFANFRDSPAVRVVDTIRRVFRASVRGDALHRHLSLENLVELTTSTETTDQRDAVYALLNLADDIAPTLGLEQTDAIIPDYEKAVLDVFVDLILHCCRRSGSLDLICRPWAPVSSTSVHSAGRQIGHDRTLPSFPSWITSRDALPFGNPSWRSKHRLHGNPLVGGSRKRVYNAHYGSRPQVSIGKHYDGSCNGSLYVRGLVLGSVAERSTRMASAIITKECLEMLRSGSHDSHQNLADVIATIWRTLCADRDEEGQRAPYTYSLAMLYLLKMKTAAPEPESSTHLLDEVSSIDVEELLETEIPGNVEEFLTVVRNVIWNRRTFRSKASSDGTCSKPFVGLIPQKSKVGDQICILYGCSVPVVLRNTHSITAKDKWQLIGDAYVHGYMDGEAISSASPETIQSRETEFRII